MIALNSMSPSQAAVFLGTIIAVGVVILVAIVLLVVVLVRRHKRNKT